jgi:hypothetical protein
MQVFRAAVRTAALALSVLVVTLAAGQAPAEGDAEYLKLVNDYARNDSAAAVAAVARWPESRVKAAVRTLDKRAIHDRTRAAVMLHTEAALGEAANQRESFHVEVARSFVSRLDRSDRDFLARWHALMAALDCVRNDPRRAQLEINQGLSVDAKHPYVNLVSGALLEYGIAQREPNLRGQWSVSAELDIAFHKQLQQAAQTYRVILSGRPDFMEARLRLGWVLTVNDSSHAAREQLESVAAQATNADVSYLAHMFLAALHERDDHPADAAREYEAAMHVAPYQSSLVALIRTAAAAGEPDRARALAADLPLMVAAGRDDPWNSYNYCFTGDALFTGLRADSRVP